MKLKKIVSLALAGILAVSMLTACGEGSSSSTPNEEPSQSTTSNLAVKLGDAMDNAVINAKVNFVNNSTLESALQHAIGDIGDNTIADGVLLPGNVTYTGNLLAQSAGLNEAYNTLEDDVDPTFGMVRDNVPNNTILQLAPNNTTGSDARYDENGVSTIMLFVVEGGVQTDNIIEQIGDDLENDLEALVNSYAYGAAQNGNVNYKYDIAVASNNKTFVDADTTFSLTFVAVEITRNIVE